MLLRLAAAVAACLFAWPAAAQVPCLFGPPEMLDQILARTGERPLIEMQMGGGPNAASSPALLAVSPEGKFTLFVLSPNGMVCIVAAGTNAQPATSGGFPKPVISGEDS